MPANDEQGSDRYTPAREADELSLARLCHPSTRIAQHLLEPLGLGALPTPRLNPANSFEAEPGSILPAQ
jgi:hypothetical protein